MLAILFICDIEIGPKNDALRVDSRRFVPNSHNCCKRPTVSQSPCTKTVTTGVPFDISAFEAHGSQGKVLVGNKGGQVLTFSPSRDGKYDFKMFRRFESKAIQQLKSVESHNLLICLCENQLNVHDLTEVATIVSKKPIKHSKINCFDVVVRECTQQIYLALSANRSIYIYEYKNGEFQEMDVEYQSNSQFLSDVEALTWCGTSRVAFSDSGQYKIIQVLKNEKYGEHPDNIGYIRELFEVGKKLDKPLIVDVSDFKIIGFCRNNEVVFSTYIGTQLKSKGTEPGEEPKYGNVRFSSTPKALIYDSPYLIAILENAVIEIRSLKSSMHIQTIELSKSRIQARMLCVSRPGQVLVSNSKDVWLLDSHKQLANNVNFLLAERQFDLAIQLAELGASIDPRSKANVLEIKREAAFQKFCQNNFVESFALYAEIKSEVWDVIALFSGLLSDDFRDKVLGGTRLPPDLNVNEARKGYGALARYLTLVRSEISSALENHHVRGEQLLDEDTLAHHEVSLQIIDTTLLKCYVNMNQTTLLASLLRLRDNSCKIDDSIEVLERVGMFEQLFLLYERRNLHEKALELLKNQSKNRESALWGTDRTIEYLQGLGNEHLPLIFHYASWILADNYEKGLSIFTSEDDETTRELDREEVHRFLMSECMDAVIPYLEFLIYEMDEQRPKFHEALAQSYIAKIKGMLKDYIHVLNVIRGGTEEGELGIYRKKLIRLLELSKNYSVDSVYAWLGNESFYEERAILLGVKNEHEKALYLYTSVLFDFIGAERFCVRHYDPNDEDKSQPIFLGVPETLQGLHKAQNNENSRLKTQSASP
ncbi:hypothetical protein L596_027872 [Steinernema carpocapsae]|uniref:CNH domain-containing protein n=1 Tax=Steinernema carpocapsae TaxID=34508 RepID=A0A4U5LWS1_STECR|nr:hypothetical protein L596_027872 [Steinernema carpocapsae]